MSSVASITCVTSLNHAPTTAAAEPTRNTPRTALPIERAAIHAGRTAVGLIPALGPIALHWIPLPPPPRLTSNMATAAELALEILLTAPVSGPGAVLANLVGSELLGLGFAGYTFHSGPGALNGLMSGMALAPMTVSARALKTYARKAGWHPFVQRFLTFAGATAFGATAGALAATIAQSRDLSAETVQEAAAAGGLATAIFGTCAAILGPHSVPHAPPLPAATSEGV